MTRWKILAGLFAASVGGVVALADPPAVPCVPAAKVKGTIQVSVPECPTQIVIPVATAEPALAKDLTFAPIEMPVKISDNAALKPVRETAPQPATPQPAPTALPTPVAKLPTPADYSVPPVPATEKNSTPVVNNSTVPPIIFDAPEKNSNVPPLPTPVATTKVVDKNPTITVAATAPAVGVVSSLEKLPVPIVTTLNLGDGKPRFEVKNGEVVQLKVVCTHIDTTAAMEQGPDHVSLIRASGKVWFAAPGCEGSCEELRFNQSTGEVILAKSITVVCKQGSSETVLRSEQMSFKIGSVVVGGGLAPIAGPGKLK